MSAYGIIKSEDRVFAGDKIRIDFRLSFLFPGTTLAAVPNYQASFNAGVSWIDVSTLKYIDYIFTTAGDKTVRLRITTSAATFDTDKTITSLSMVTQGLFSKDNDLYVFEPEIDQYLPEKWSSWNLVHLQAQEWIIDWLDESRIHQYDGTKYAVEDVMDIQQVKQLSIYKTLEFIFSGNSNMVGDLYSIKAAKYAALAKEKLSRGSLKLDFDKDAATTNGEFHDLFTGTLVRK